MPGASAIQKANRAKERMFAAERALREFIERHDRTFTPNELRQQRTLATLHLKAINEYMQAMNKAR
jgi:E3 ubiquitin-protein ligase DOA10